MKARDVLLAYGNGWHGADCAGNFGLDAACSCGLAEWVERVEKEAATTDEPGLRERLEDAHECGYREGYRAALAAPAASDGSLDVERLARALGKVGNAIEIMTDEEAAEAVAREYARLSESPSEGKTE